MLTNAIYIVELIFGLGLVVLVHELGHFLAAKMLGIKAETFSLGFGPRLVGFDWGGTDCRLSLIPLGGYVMLPGQTPDEETSDDPTQLSNRPVWQRIVVFSAGVVMNVVLSIVLFALAFSIGVPLDQAVVGEVAPDGPADQAGIRRGDKIVGINGDRNVDLEDLVTTVAFSDEDQRIELTVLRDGNEMRLTVVPVMDDELGLPGIGIVPASGTEVKVVDPGSAAEAAGLRPGDRILTLDDVPVFDNIDVGTYLGCRPETDITMELLREGKTVTTVIRPPTVETLVLKLVPAEPLVVKLVMSGSVAEQAGLQPGDGIISVDGVSAETPDLVSVVIGRSPGKEMEYVIRRGGKELTLRMTARSEPHRLQPRIGIAWDPERPVVVGQVEPDSPLAGLGIRPGDRITAVAGAKVKNWDALDNVLFKLARKEKSDNFEVTLKWEGHGEESTASVKLKRTEVPGFAGQIGVGVSPRQWRVRKYPVMVAPWMGMKKTVVFVKQMVLLARGIGRRRVAPGKALGGPVRIFQIAFAAASIGPTYLMYFWAMIGVNLAVFNFLPIPVLDGGHVTLALLEKVRGKPLSRKWHEIVTYIGLALILGLVLLITYNDILRLFTGE